MRRIRHIRPSIACPLRRQRDISQVRRNFPHRRLCKLCLQMQLQPLRPRACFQEQRVHTALSGPNIAGKTRGRAQTPAGWSSTAGGTVKRLEKPERHCSRYRIMSEQRRSKITRASNGNTKLRCNNNENSANSSSNSCPNHKHIHNHGRRSLHRKHGR